IGLSVLIITGCGGGGGGGGGGGSAPTPPSSSAVNDTASTNEDASVSIAVLSNDNNVTASSLALGNNPSNGTISLSGSSITYTPAADFNGTDSFTYRVNSTTGQSLTATVTVTVSSVNDLPVSQADTVIVIENTPSVLNLFSNDTDIDGTLSSYNLISNPANGSISTSGSTLTYTPNDGYTGSDSFTYQAVDNESGASNTSAVSITINAITQTSLIVSTLPVPTSGYQIVNNSDIGADILTSEQTALTIPPNTVSFGLYLRGADVSSSSGLFFSNVQNPNGNGFNNMLRNFEYCDSGLCAAVTPKNGSQIVQTGQWQYQLGTRASNLSGIDTSGMNFQLAARIGPTPNLNGAGPFATIKVQPFITTANVDDTQFSRVLDNLRALAAGFGLTLDIQNPVRLTDARFTEVSSDFNNTDTAALITQGSADAANIFFIESFTGTGGGGRIGISPGIPGTLGVQSQYNGVLINLATTLQLGVTAADGEILAAETALHEMGHLLGLFHTTESNFTTDIIADTVACVPDDVTPPASGNKAANAIECPDRNNLMFFTNDLITSTALELSDTQRKVIVFNPIAKP
ncbi:MAG: tandem-95 repeat protein, partial [Pseudomonadales bacterium]|nr:tandem-95 repeat protein [Pseudomonadales bacterium]